MNDVLSILRSVIEDLSCYNGCLDNPPVLDMKDDLISAVKQLESYNMLTSEIIMSAIGIVNENKVSEFEVKADSHANYDMVTIKKEHSNPFTYTDLVKVTDSIPAMDDFKVSLQYGDDGGEYFGCAYMDEMDCEGDNRLVFNGDSNMNDEDAFQCKHLKLRYYNATYKERTIYIQNMDGGGEYSGSRPMEYMEIYIDKTGSNHRVNLG